MDSFESREGLRSRERESRDMPSLIPVYSEQKRERETKRQTLTREKDYFIFLLYHHRQLRARFGSVRFGLIRFGSVRFKIFRAGYDYKTF